MTAERSHKRVPKGRIRSITMTHQHIMSMADLQKNFLGFDRLQNDFFNNTLDQGYPRYNLIKAGSGYRIELAIPGWDKSDLDISLFKNVLTIQGTQKQTEKNEETYIHKGLSGKCFKRAFTVGEYIKLEKAYMAKGLLCISLVEELPETEKPIIVKIN